MTCLRAGCPETSSVVHRAVPTLLCPTPGTPVVSGTPNPAPPLSPVSPALLLRGLLLALSVPTPWSERAGDLGHRPQGMPLPGEGRG